MTMLPLNRPSRIKPGIYKVRVKEVDASGTGPSGYTNVKITYDLLMESGRPSGREIRDNISMSPKALFKWDQFADAAGFEESEDEMDARSLKGTEIIVRVEDTIYKGAKQTSVAAYLTPLQAAALDLSEVTEAPAASASNGQPGPFRPSNPLEDEGEGEESLTSILEGEGEDTDEDIAF